MTVRRYAERKQWPLRHIEARVKAHDAAGGGYEKISVDLRLDGDLTAEQRARLLELATRCTISRTLKNGVAIELRESTSA